MSAVRKIKDKLAGLRELITELTRGEDVYERITDNPEALADFLRRLPVLTAPWDEAFHRAYCDNCPAGDCSECPNEKYRNNPLWYLGLPAEEVDL